MILVYLVYRPYRVNIMYRVYSVVAHYSVAALSALDRKRDATRHDSNKLRPQVNALIAANSTEVTGPPQRLDPAKGNVCFASAQHGWAFTTASFAKVTASVLTAKPARVLVALGVGAGVWMA